MKEYGCGRSGPISSDYTNAKWRRWTGSGTRCRAALIREWAPVIPISTKRSAGASGGLPLPRVAGLAWYCRAAKGSEIFRKEVFPGAADVDLTMLLNRGGWVFDEAEQRYTICLTVIARGGGTGKTIGLRGPVFQSCRFRNRAQHRGSAVFGARGFILERQRLPAAIADRSLGRNICPASQVAPARSQ